MNFKKYFILFAAILCISLMMNRVRHVNSSSQIHRPPPLSRENLSDFSKEIDEAEQQLAEIESMLDTATVKVIELNGNAELYGKAIRDVAIGRCVRVVEGDLIEMLDGDRNELKIRLDSIDCPEKTQPFGDAAKLRTTELCLGKELTVLKTGTDQDGCTIGFVLIGDAMVGDALLLEGLAWLSPTNSADGELEKFATEAKAEGAGLWSDGNAVPPWEWGEK